jgi:sugar phosphate isomerase/epimerase
VRFLADMGVDIRVVHWLRTQGHDANARAQNVMRRLRTVLAESHAAFARGVIIAVEETRHRIRYLPIGLDR